MGKRIANIVLAVIIPCAVVLSLRYVCVLYGVQGWYQALALAACAGAALVLFFLSADLHEAGHILFGKAGKMRLLGAKFSFFKIETVNGERKVSLGCFFKESTYSTMVLTDIQNAKSKLLSYIAGGPVVSFTLAMLGLQAAVRGLFGVAFFWEFPIGLPLFVINTYYFCVNGIPKKSLADMTDGGYWYNLKKDTDTGKAFLLQQTAQAEILSGKSAGEIRTDVFADLFLLDDDPCLLPLLGLRLEKALLTADMENIRQTAQRLYNLLPEDVPCAYEAACFFYRLFSACLLDTEPSLICLEMLDIEETTGETEDIEKAEAFVRVWLQDAVLPAAQGKDEKAETGEDLATPTAAKAQALVQADFGWAMIAFSVLAKRLGMSEWEELKTLGLNDCQRQVKDLQEKNRIINGDLYTKIKLLKLL